MNASDQVPGQPRLTGEEKRVHADAYYLAANLRECLSDLAQSRETIRYRLYSAATSYFFKLEAEDFPLQWMRREWADIQRELSQVKDPVRGSYAASIPQMSEEQAAELIHRVVVLAQWLFQWCGADSYVRGQQPWHGEGPLE